MLETRRGSGDGFTVRCYEVGEIYDLPAGLARSLIAEGSSEQIPIKKEHTMNEAYIPRRLEEFTQPTEEPLTLAEAKLYLRVDTADEDALITQMIVAVRRAAEHYLRRTLVTRQWKLVYDEVLSERVRLPMTPVTSIVRVTKIAEGGASEDIASTLYALNAARTHLCMETRISAHQIEIVYQAGYGAAAAVPASIKQGMLSHLAELYDGRAAAYPLPDAAIALYFPHREVTL